MKWDKRERRKEKCKRGRSRKHEGGESPEEETGKLKEEYKGAEGEVKEIHEVGRENFIER